VEPQPPSTVLEPAPLILPSSGTAVSTHRIPNDLKQWQPRVGLAWSPGSKITLRFSAGLYTAHTPATFFHRVFTNGRNQTDTLDSYFDPALIALSGGNTASPHALGFAPAGLNIYHAQIIAMDQNFRNPASLQAAASIEQQRSTHGPVHCSISWFLVMRRFYGYGSVCGVCPGPFFLCVEIIFPLQSLSSALHRGSYKTFTVFLTMHWSPRMAAIRPILAASLSLVFTLPLVAQQYPTEMLSGLHWRDVGPMRAGRTYGVSGNAAQPDTFYMGSVGGGVWKT
jgi:hypothetical protein